MVVPADLRAMVGKTAWTESLGTTDPLLAAEKRGMLIARHKALIRELRDASGRRAEVEALALLDRAFAGLAVARGSMDAAVGQQLNLLATFVCDSWAGGEEAGQPQWWGDIPVHEPATIIDVVPSIDAEPERDVFRLRAEILEGRGIADGLVYQELATILLRRRVFRPIWFVVSYMRSIEPRLNLEPDDVYDAVAEAYLRKLAEHRFDHWPSNIHAAMIPFAQTNVPQPITLPSLPAKAAAPTLGRHNGLLAMPLTEACRYWQEQRRPGASAITEAKRAVARFVALFGDVVVGDITRDQVIEIRNLVSDIPPQTELARVVASGRNRLFICRMRTRCCSTDPMFRDVAKRNFRRALIRNGLVDGIPCVIDLRLDTSGFPFFRPSLVIRRGMPRYPRDVPMRRRKQFSIPCPGPDQPTRLRRERSNYRVRA